MPAGVDSRVGQNAPDGNGGVAEPSAETFDVSTRTDDQLRYLASNGKPGWKEAAQAEMARREGAKPAEPDSGLPDSRAGGSGERVAEPVSAPYKLPLNLRDKNAALVEMASLMGKSDKEVRESFSAMWKREGRESAEKRLVATVERLRAEKNPEASVSTESNPASANQNPIKTETRANAVPATETASANQEKAKSPSDLEALFSGLDSSSVRKANKAKKAAKAHPLADKIQNVQDNFLDILQELEDSGKVKINC